MEGLECASCPAKTGGWLSGWVFSRYICATPETRGLPPSPALPTLVHFLGYLGVSRNHEAAHSSALRFSSADKGHVLTGALFPA